MTNPKWPTRLPTRKCWTCITEPMRFCAKGSGPGYRLDNPRSQGNCTICHAPSVAGSIPWSQDLNDVLRSPRTEWDGISCDYCHKVRKVIKDKNKPSGTGSGSRKTISDPRAIRFWCSAPTMMSPPRRWPHPIIRCLTRDSFVRFATAIPKSWISGKTWDSSKVYIGCGIGRLRAGRQQLPSHPDHLSGVETVAGSTAGR